MPPALPPSASVATPSEGAKLVAPSAARNVAALTDLIRTYAPGTGHALEIASGTGQHVSAFAAALPTLRWQPTEMDAARRASIDAYAAEAGLTNVAAALHLDAAADGWGQAHPNKDLITLANLLHLITTPATRTLIREAASALAEAGTFILYGPFKRSGVLTSDGDARFDAELRGADAAIGYKDDLDIIRWLSDAGLNTVETVLMPANNLAFIARK